MVVEAGRMDKKLIRKMIQNCFKQYYSDAELLPISNADIEMICSQILKIKREEPSADLYEIVNDRVYEFLTD
jgi:hypothetical protein